MSRPFIPVPNTCSVEMIYLYATQMIENQFHVEGGAPFTLAQVQQLRGVFDAWHNSYWKTVLPQQAILVRIKTKALDAPDSPMEDYTVGSGRAGTVAGNYLPGAITLAIKLGTDTAGRSSRGRIFVTGIPYNWTDGGNRMTVAPTNYTGGIDLLRTNITAANAAWHLVVTSYMTNKVWRAQGVNYRITSAVLTDFNLDVQRRRMTGRGRT